jgi:hypothetical protein
MDPSKFAVIFPETSFVPVVLGFFGLGVGYLIYGPQELFHAPHRDASVDRATGVWGIFMPGLCQLLAGVYLFVGLTWFQVFHDKALYMAALAFSVYGIHWFALGWNRFQQSDARPNGGMSIGFTIISVLGMVVFFGADAWPVGLLFAGLTAVYVTEFFASVPLGGNRASSTGRGKLLALGEKGLGFFHIATGIWLMYLTFATTLNITSGYKLPGG